MAYAEPDRTRMLVIPFRGGAAMGTRVVPLELGRGCPFNARRDDAKPQLHLLAPLAATPVYERYRDTLIWSTSFSDVSFQGWRPNPGDRALIARYSDVFPHFCAVPVRQDREFLKEFRGFFQDSLLRLRWLMVALHRDCPDLLKLFEARRAWRRKKGKTHLDSSLMGSLTMSARSSPLIF